MLHANDTPPHGAANADFDIAAMFADDKSHSKTFMRDCADSVEFTLTSSVNKYEKLFRVGLGTFGDVFKARHRSTKQYVALKRIKMEQEKEGFPITALREIKLLQSLNHENVVNLIEICSSKGEKGNRYRPEFYLVFEFCDHDLAGLLSSGSIKFSLGEIKSLMNQLFAGLNALHCSNILHRDVKAANILISKDGVLKLADFGLARVFSSGKGEHNRYTSRVVTLWYRPPELLLGDRNYGPPIDMWGAGCIMAEMWTKCPVMQGNTEQRQLTLIVNLCGSITPEVWPAVDQLEVYCKMQLPKTEKRKVKERLSKFVPDFLALDLIDKLLTLDPMQRFTADDALSHDFFFLEPLPANVGPMLRNLSQSFLEYLLPPRQSVSDKQPVDNQHYDRVF